MDSRKLYGCPSMVTAPITVPDVTTEQLRMLDLLDSDQPPTINVFGVPREIRHYDSTAVVFRNWDDPRQLLFSWHDSRYLIIIDNEYEVECQLNDPNVEQVIRGELHTFRLCTSTTLLLYIDDIAYDGYSVGPATSIIQLGKRPCLVRIEGAPPNVEIGPKRQDLVAGKVTLMVNDAYRFELFLDSKAQKIEVEGCTIIFVFIDSLRGVLVNGVPFAVDFGGVLHAFQHRDKLFFFRFSILPLGIVPGTVQINRMMTLSPGQPIPLSYSAKNTAGEKFPPLSNVPEMTIVPLPGPIIFKNHAEPLVFTDHIDWHSWRNHRPAQQLDDA